MRWATFTLAIALALSACAATNRVDDLEQRIGEIEGQGNATDAAIVWCARPDNEAGLLVAIAVLELEGMDDLVVYSKEMEAKDFSPPRVAKLLKEYVQDVWREEHPMSYDRACQAAFDSR